MHAERFKGSLTPPAQNRFLDAIPGAVLDRVRDRLDRVHVPLKRTIYEPGARMDHVYFPLDAVISVVAVMNDGTQVEALTVGREGVTGIQGLLDDGIATQLTWCQVPGEAYRASFATFVELCSERGVRELADRYLAVQYDTMAQTIACNRLHLVAARCARWILMTSDRVGRDDFQLTHEALATMLGVRRAGVTMAASRLQQQGFIRYSRGRITVVDRAGLESAACECYRAINDAFRRRLLPAC